MIEQIYFQKKRLIKINLAKDFIFANHFISPGGEIGRRTAFRWQRSQGCAGSNPVPGTKKLYHFLIRFFFDHMFLLRLHL
jgi:hypothetical protein